MPLGKIPEIEKAVVFGSRAIGNDKTGSDVDLAIYGDAVPRGAVLALQDELNEELPLPYMFDVLHYEEIDNPKLKEHIDRFGKVIYCKDDE